MQIRRTETVTWLCCVSLASLSSNTVIPASVGVLNESSQTVEQLREGHVAGLVDGVVEQGSAPQCGIFSEQDAVNAGQTLLCGIERL